MDYKECPEQQLVELRISQKVTEHDFDIIAPKLEAFTAQHGRIKFLEVIENFEGMAAGLIFKGIRFDIKHLKHISHVAVVSDIGWMSPLSKAAGALVSTKFRTFSMDQLGEARHWLSTAEE